MADQTTFVFDVWLTHAGTVYRAVPFAVVTDWIQQGRLLDDDRIRPVGTEQWFILGEVPAFAAFIPRPDALRTDAQAEALEPVESGFNWGKKGEEEEADPDMIPLIDVSLVLLIFFILTSTISVVSSRIKTPDVENIQDAESPTKMVWVGVEFIDDYTKPHYTIRVELEDNKKSMDKDLSKEKALERIDELCKDPLNPIPEVIIAAHRQLPFEEIKELSIELEKLKSAKRIMKIKVEISEKKQ